MHDPDLADRVEYEAVKAPGVPGHVEAQVREEVEEPVEQQVDPIQEAVADQVEADVSGAQGSGG